MTRGSILKTQTIPELMERKKRVYKTLAEPITDDSDELSRICAQVELDVINREINRR